MNSEQVERSEPSRSKRRRHTKRWVVLALFILIGGAVLFIVRSLNMPAEGMITPTKMPSLPKPAELHTSYFVTEYPKRYSSQSPPSQMSASLGAWVLKAQQAPGAGQSSTITLIVTTLPAGGVTEDSAYKLYASQPQYYTLSQTNYDDEPVTVAVRHDPSYQKTILWPHGKYLLTATVTAAGEQDGTESDFQIVLSNLRWQQ